MGVVLIYENGFEYEPDTQIEEFENREELIDFINDNGIHKDSIYGMYEIAAKLEIEPVEVIKRYQIKE